MLQRFTCPLGHAWEEDPVPGSQPLCPACGTPTPASEPPTLLITTAPSPPRVDDILPSLPEYEIIGELGRGGMGIVYKAVERNGGRTVAIKVIRKDRLQHDEAVRRFRREAQAASRLNHANIVRVFDSDHTGNTHFLAMEYVPGVTLERFVEQHGPIPFELACDFVRQAALGLAHAHEQRLVHRDIKPSNLMITPAAGRHPDGSPSLVKILDMGVARVLRSEQHPGEALSTLTQGGSVIGTADFVAPEQLEDPHGADIRADLYSLGCTFHFILVGDVPFPGGSLVSKLDKQRWHMPPAVSELRPGILPGVAEVVRKLMAKKPGDRYQSPTELLSAFAELERSKYLSSVPAAPVPREVRMLAGHTASVQAVAITPDATRAASASRDHVVRFWDLGDGTCLRTLPRLPHEVRAVAFGPRGDLLAAAVGVSLRLWDAGSGQEIARLGGHSAAVRTLVFTPDGKWLISGSDDRTIRIWDLKLGREVQRLVRHTASVTCLALTPDGDQLLSGSRDQTLRRWDLRSGQEAGVLAPDGGPLLAVALSPDGRRAASAHFDTVLRLWSFPDGLAQGELHGHKQMVTGVGFLPDGLSLLSVSQDHTVRWWDILRGTQRAVLEPHQAGIHALAVASSARLALTAGGDQTVRLLDIPA